MPLESDHAGEPTDRAERRRGPRVSLAVPLTVATGSEHLVTGGRTVDISAVGVLAAFPGVALPIGVGDRCLLSLQLHDGALHLLAWVRRRERGADEQLYVGFEYDELSADDGARVRAAAGLCT